LRIKSGIKQKDLELEQQRAFQMAEFYENKEDCGTAMSFFKRFHFVSMVLKDKQNTCIALNRLGNLSMKNNLVT